MTNEQTYNGWTNYETWLVNLWLDNVEGSYRYWTQAARDAVHDCDGHREKAINTLADMLKEEHEEGAAAVIDRSRLNSLVWADLLNSALSEVDWHDIAEHWIANVWADAMPFEFDPDR